MNSFMEIVKYEYKKTLRRRSSVIALVFGLAVSVLSICGVLMSGYYIDGRIYESNYDAMVKDRYYAREISGRKLDDALLLEAAAGYRTIPETVGVYQGTDEYQQYARPYSSIYSLARQVYRTSADRFEIKNMGNLTKEQAEQFYASRMERIEEEVNATLMSDKAKKAVIEKARLKEPITFSYMDGYENLFTILYTSGAVAAFVMAICIAPLFAGEYASGADQLILSSRYGKGKLIGAKLFAGFSLAAAIALIFILQAYIQCMLLYGPDGKDNLIQTIDILCTYQFTAKTTALLQSISILLGCLFLAAATMFLSAKLKSSFGVIILITIFLIVPMLVNVPEKPLLPYLLSLLMPVTMMSYWQLTEINQFEISGMVIPPYIAGWVFASFCILILTPFAYRAFKKHQIG